jgi:SNF family Na+-dependent transporter
MAAEPSALVDVVMKSIEFRQTVITVLLGVVGFILGKTWRDRTGQLDHTVFRRMCPAVLFAAASLVLMFYEQRKALQAISRDAIPDFATHWLNFGEPALDTLIVCAALALLLGALR